MKKLFAFMVVLSALVASGCTKADTDTTTTPAETGTAAPADDTTETPATDTPAEPANP